MLRWVQWAFGLILLLWFLVFIGNKRREGRIHELRYKLSFVRGDFRMASFMSANELKTFYEANNYYDPFSTEPYRQSEDEKGRVVFYSVGPDKEDQSGHLFYDPTNGLWSAGDVVAVLGVVELRDKYNRY